MVPKSEAMELDLTIEEAMRFTISGGVITPSTKLDKYGKIALPEKQINIKSQSQKNNE
jgi:uncharacterized membrane protein